LGDFSGFSNAQNHVKIHQIFKKINIVFFEKKPFFFDKTVKHR